MGACILGSNVPGCTQGHLRRRTAGRGTCEGERLRSSLNTECGALGGRHRRGGRLGGESTQRYIMAPIAPSAKIWHRSGLKRRLRGGKREGLKLSRMRGIGASGDDGVRK